VLAARGRDQLEQIANELRPTTRVLAIPMDVADPGACADLLQRAQDEFGSIDVLVNNAGYHSRGPVENNSADDLGRMIDVNLKAPIVLSRLAIPYMRNSSGGAAIINVASLAGRVPLNGAATYSASKFGLRAFTFALGEELRGTNIKVAAVSPGPIDTGFIMADIDSVTDLTFSQPLSTSEQVADEIMQLCTNTKRERSMPPISGLLTTMSYLFPWLARQLQPLLARRGRNVKRRLKAAIESKSAARE
jgi:short-subunit dehydrogenase